MDKSERDDEEIAFNDFNDFNDENKKLRPTSAADTLRT